MSGSATAASTNTRAIALENGREFFKKHAWGSAFVSLSAADVEGALDADDLGLLSQSALLIGKDAEGMEMLGRAYRARLSGGNVQAAARCALLIAKTALFSGEASKSAGWLSRAERLLENCEDCAEKGYALLLNGIRAFYSGDCEAALSAFADATTKGRRFGDRDLETLAMHGMGRTSIRSGEIERGMALLDEAMIAVTDGEVSALAAGGVYCGLLDACSEVYDLRRAKEWTESFDKWCEAQPDLVPFRAHCLVRRSEMMHLHGEWSVAFQCAERAMEWLSKQAPSPEIGAAFYRMGEAKRLLGEFSASEDAYRKASEWKTDAGPGMARLRMAQGQIGAALAAIKRMLGAAREPVERAKILDAYVEIALAAGDVMSAREVADDLAAIADRQKIPFLRALSHRAFGAVLLAEGDANAALVELKQSWTAWTEFNVPHKAARARIQIAIACNDLGDRETAILELNAARAALERLGAAPDIARVSNLLSKISKIPGPLTDREVEVIRLIAAGMSNKGIGGELRISERTVARHVSNIFTKLDLPSRAAAAAYAYENNLV